MEELILLAAFIAIGIPVYFLMGKMDRFLEKNYEVMQEQEEENTPPNSK